MLFQEQLCYHCSSSRTGRNYTYLAMLSSHKVKLHHEGFCYGTEQLKGRKKWLWCLFIQKCMENPLGWSFEFAERGEGKELISLSIFYSGFCCKLWVLLHYLSGWTPEPQKLIPEQTILACEVVWTQDARWQQATEKVKKPNGGSNAHVECCESHAE